MATSASSDEPISSASGDLLVGCGWEHGPLPKRPGPGWLAQYQGEDSSKIEAMGPLEEAEAVPLRHRQVIERQVLLFWGVSNRGEMCP